MNIFEGNSHHLKILKLGVAEWNKWRKDNPSIVPDLDGANLKNQDFKGLIHEEGSDKGYYEGINLNDSILTNVDFSNANLNYASFKNANLSAANFDSASLFEVDFENSILQKVNFVDADLTGSHLWKADIRGADLRMSNFRNTNVTYIKYDLKMKCRGIRIETSTGSADFKRAVQDQDFIEEFKEKHRPTYFLWKITSNCGRSLIRWTFWSAALAVFFAIIYTFCLGQSHFFFSNVENPLPFNIFTMGYYSIVTFTTLGFGDITPQTPLSAALVTIEVVLGYIMLGGLISIFASKISRRS